MRKHLGEASQLPLKNAPQFHKHFVEQLTTMSQALWLKLGTQSPSPQTVSQEHKKNPTVKMEETIFVPGREFI